MLKILKNQLPTCIIQVFFVPLRPKSTINYGTKNNSTIRSTNLEHKKQQKLDL